MLLQVLGIQTWWLENNFCLSADLLQTDRDTVNILQRVMAQNVICKKKKRKSKSDFVTAGALVMSPSSAPSDALCPSARPFPFARTQTHTHRRAPLILSPPSYPGPPLTI